MEYEIQKHLHYAGIPSFNLYPYTQDTECADITIMGVPFDSGVTNRPGARLGPRAIRNMSQLTNCFAYPWSYKLSDKAKIVDYGDVGYYVGANTTKVMLEETYNTAKKFLNLAANFLPLAETTLFHMVWSELQAKSLENLLCCILTLIRTALRPLMEMYPTQTSHMTYRLRGVSTRHIRRRFL